MADYDVRIPPPSAYIPRNRMAKFIRESSEEQDRQDSACGWPEIETIAPPNAESLGLIDVADWEGVAVPERKWIVRDWIPMHGVTLVAGKGGTGKSLAVQHWLSAIAVGAEFMGLRSTAPIPSLYINCEDTADELHRRQDAIARAMGRSLAGFGSSLRIGARVGKENALGTVDDKGKFQPAPLLHAIKAQCLALGIRVIALDNAMQHYVGNPNDNGEVTRFLNALTALALEIDGAVILVAHTAKADGSEFMGCMAWENGVRSRLFLTRDNEEDEASDVRILSRNKSNMAAIGERIEMEWSAGAFRPLDRTSDDSADARHEAAFLRCLDAATDARRNVSHLPGVNYACTTFARMPEAEKRTAKTLAAAMDRLIYRGAIKVDEPLWKGNDRHWKTGLKRAEKCGNPPAGTPCGNLREPPSQVVENAAVTLRAGTPLYTTYNGAGPDGPPPLEVSEYSDWRGADEAHADAMGWEAAND